MKQRANYTVSRKPIHGFTLIELLVVIAVIALLLSILLPSLKRVKEKGRQIVCMSHCRSIITAACVYANNYDDQIPHSRSNQNASLSYFLWYNFGSQGDGWLGHGLLYDTGLIEDEGIFYCPSQKHPKLREKEGWEYQFGSGGYLEHSTSYLYGLLGEIRAAPELELDSVRLSNLKARALFADNFVPVAGYSPEISAWSHPKGLSAAFGDTHVEFIKVEQKWIDTSDTLRIAPTAEIDRSDLFVGLMFELMAGRSHAIESRFP